MVVSPSRDAGLLDERTSYTVSVTALAVIAEAW